MPQTVTIDKKTAESLIDAILSLKKEIALLRQSREAQYGSMEWWHKSTKQGLKDIENGDYEAFGNVEDLIKSLHE